jgi:hypothetical protein
MFCRFTPRLRDSVQYKTPFAGLLGSSTLAHEYPNILSTVLFAMIDPEDRFFSVGQGYFGPRENPTTETHCNVWDWDQLRLIKVKGTAKLFPSQEDVETSILAQFADFNSNLENNHLPDCKCTC